MTYTEDDIEAIDRATDIARNMRPDAASALLVIRDHVRQAIDEQAQITALSDAVEPFRGVAALAWLTCRDAGLAGSLRKLAFDELPAQFQLRYALFARTAIENDRMMRAAMPNEGYL
ncbi:DUF222 domain-containing protein [Nocardia ninae]|uniref:Uncharacterized protein n=1 Tax=Nocardia ninae NBRC 108245 TaxID=1210091 RepID=A0A511MPR0_9NOCA|nr:hypothetical protein [Nocardia ninae]GEM41936.1 hypothetical protein NN4_64550 [Nocardia ninae NBRC 108245]